MLPNQNNHYNFLNMNPRAISTTIVSHPSSSPFFTHFVSYNVSDYGIIRSQVVTESSLAVHSNNESVKSPIESNNDNTDDHVGSWTDPLCGGSIYTAPLWCDVMILMEEVTLKISCNRFQVFLLSVDFIFVTSTILPHHWIDNVLDIATHYCKRRWNFVFNY